MLLKMNILILEEMKRNQVFHYYDMYHKYNHQYKIMHLKRNLFHIQKEENLF